MTTTLALLNLGPTEVVLILLLVLLLFGADKLPDLARSLGRARAQMEGAARQVRETMKTEDEHALDEQLKFERAREHQVAMQDPEFLQLTRAAEELGLATEGLTKEQLRAAIGARLKA